MFTEFYKLRYMTKSIVIKCNLVVFIECLFNFIVAHRIKTQKKIAMGFSAHW